MLSLALAAVLVGQAPPQAISGGGPPTLQVTIAGSLGRNGTFMVSKIRSDKWEAKYNTPTAGGVLTVWFCNNSRGGGDYSTTIINVYFDKARPLCFEGTHVAPVPVPFGSLTVPFADAENPAENGATCFISG